MRGNAARAKARGSVLLDALSYGLKRVGLFDPARRVKRLFWSRVDRDRWERALALYSQFIAKGDLCFDIGANRGRRTDVFWHLGARVVAVEPQSECVEELLRLHGHHSTVVVLNSAVGSAIGEARMAISDEQPLISSMSEEWINAVVDSGRWSEESWNREVMVPVTTLDQLIADHGLPRFCKIDVEGYELEALCGLSRLIPVVSFEFTQERLGECRQCVGRLLQLGSREFTFSVGESFELDRWSGPEVIFERLDSYLENREQVSGDIYARS